MGFPGMPGMGGMPGMAGMGAPAAAETSSSTGEQSAGAEGFPMGPGFDNIFQSYGFLFLKLEITNLKLISFGVC
jgi:hypothetical protein